MKERNEISIRDVLQAHADDLASDLLRAVNKVKDYMEFISKDLKKDGSKAGFSYRGDLTDSFFEVHRGIEGMDAVNSAMEKIEEFIAND